MNGFSTKKWKVKGFYNRQLYEQRAVGLHLGSNNHRKRTQDLYGVTEV